MALTCLLPFFFSSCNLKVYPYEKIIYTQAATSGSRSKLKTTCFAKRSVHEGISDTIIPRVTPEHDNEVNINPSYEVRPLDSKVTGKTVNNKTMDPPSPWRASFMVSKKTQSRIIEAGRSYVYSDTTDRAIQVLQTLLCDTPSYECNESNVVCALTLSAKIMSQGQPSPSMHYTRKRNRSNTDSQFTQKSKKHVKLHDLLLESISIAYQLILDNRMSNRQLANVIWAIAKHHSTRQGTSSGSKTDYLPILPIIDFDIVEVSEEYHHHSDDEPMNNKVRREPIISKYERLPLYSTDSLKERLIIVTKTVDEICKRLCSILEKGCILQNGIHEEGKNITNHLDSKKRSTRETLNIVEIAMSFWSFAIFLPRDRPPGWESPVRIVKATRDGIPTSGFRTVYPSMNSTSTDQWITFEQRKELKQASTRTVPKSLIKDSDFVVTRNGLNADRIQAFFHGASEYVLRVSSMQDTLSTMKWQDLVNILWSLAYSGQGGSLKCEDLVVVIAQEVTRRLEHVHTLPSMLIPKSRDLAQIAWALAILQCNHFRLSTTLIQFINALSVYLASDKLRYENDMVQGFSMFHGWTKADIVQLAVCLAHGRLERNDILLPLYEEVISSLKSISQDDPRAFSNGELTALLWTQARLYLVDNIFRTFAELATRTLLQRVYPQSTGPRSSFNMDVYQLDAQEQANLAWSLVVLEQYTHSEAAATLLNVIFGSSSSLFSEGSSFHVEHAHQLWQAYSILQIECPNVVENIPLDFIEFLQQRWKKEKLRLKTSSDRHIALSKTLELMGVAHRNEHDEDIDVAIILKSHSQWTKKSMILDDSCMNDNRDFHKVAVEFDGPTHFVRPINGYKLSPKECPRPLGHTVLKYRLLKYQGWHVIRVPYYEYDKIPFWASMVSTFIFMPSCRNRSHYLPHLCRRITKEKQRYLQRLLKTEAKRYFSNIDVSDYKAITPNRLSRFD